MNWDAIGAIAELLGAIGVIASLVYLATQIRDSRRALPASAYQQFDQSLHEAMMSPATQPSLLKAVQGGMVDFSQMDADRWEMNRADIAAMFSSPGVAHWWSLKPDAVIGSI